ncbi:hypothetical protein PVAND_017116 [Polypedilum vanderplanki]|uniref:Uncharacterized protein n=1 Tax=Polypedilum vanderplanki TaxID=319348 RepID=A0A9J6BHT3_POLVA|nr:hypothetical protein PVAND_017116 [Polypedilum vanderplanki]
MSCCGFISTFCVFVVSVQLICGVFRFLYQQFIGPLLNGKSTDFKKYGQWALVTGATDGIGKEYARSLAKRGLNIILVSRTLSKLETVAKEISEAFNVETAVIDVNFTSGPEIYDKIKEKIHGKEIGILVNNVGMGYITPDYFLSIPNRDQMIKDMIQCNVLSIPMMCSIILPQMVERKKGLVITISSLSAIIPAGCMTVYSATKAFAHKFSEDLSMEYGKHGIKVQSILPGPVATNMTRLKKGSLMAPKADKFVESALLTVDSAPYSTGYFPHVIFQVITQFLSFLMPSYLTSLTLKTMENVRNRSIKKGLYTPVASQ